MSGNPQHHDEGQEQQPIAVSSLNDERGANSVRSVEEGVMEEYSEKPPPPPRRRFYKQKKYWIICSILTAIIVVVVVLLIIYVFFPMIAQTIMNKAGIQVDSAQITFTDPTSTSGGSNSAITKRQPSYNMNSTFFMSMSSKLTNTGPFSASIKFHNPIEVYYNNTMLGTITLPDTHVSGGSGQLQAVTPFFIADMDKFTAFAKDMLAQETFIWNMKGKLDISALSRTATVNLDKDIVLNGMDGFPNVKITSFQLPGDAPGGGIEVELGTALTSPSPIGVQLGTIALRIGYDGVVLGQVTAENVTLKEGENDILLKGVLVPQTDPTALSKVGVLFSNYVAGKVSQTTATGISCAPDGIHSIGWLSESFQTVQLNVGLGASQPLDIIKGVSMGYLDLKFSESTPYAPIASAPAVVADFQIPFGFTLNITEVSQDLRLGTNQTGDFASLQVPFVAAQSDQKAGKLQFAMDNVAIQAITGDEAQFDDFTYSLTASDLYTFQVSGNATTKTQTPIGNIQLSGITFSVPTSLHGLQFLNSTPTIVNGVDVTGGTEQDLLLSINVTMGNPSDFSISTGDVSFNFLASGEQLGSVMLSNLTLQRGSNNVTASSTFNPKVSNVGQNLLSTFVMGQNNDVNIAGYQGSTAIASLVKALQSIDISTTLPGLKSKLIQGSKLTVNQDSAQNGIVNVQVSIANPFTAGLTITKVISSVTYQGMPVGNINQDISSSPLVVGGHSTVQSNPLQMTMNIEPAAVALLLRELAVSSNMDTRALDALLTMGGFHIAGQQQIVPDSSLFSGFNISSYVMQAMQALKVDLQLQSTLTIGQYVDDLQFAQSDVAVATDSTVTRLIPIVGQPIVQQIVDGAQLGFDTIVLSSPTDTSFKVQMSGSITNAGPMDAEISFPVPLTIYWQGRELGKVAMATIQSKANVGANFNVPGDFSITDQTTMGDFAGFMINNDEFQWEITTSGVAVTALGYTFTNISMNKFVTLKGAGGFKNAVTINSFNLPSNDPAGGITLVANTSIINPSQVGFDLSGAGFSTYFNNILIGPLASDGAANFPPKGTANINMKGRMIPQESQAGLDAVTELFENYLQAKDTPLTVLGESGSGPNGQVGWLTAGFKTIKIENVILPGPDKPPTLIPAITMKDMEIDFTKSAYAPPAGSTQVEAQLKNPFGFPLGVTQLNMDVTASYQGQAMASLNVPDEKATTSDTGVVTTQFSDLPFSTFDNAHDLFNSYLKAITSSQNVTFGLSGSSNAVTSTAIGTLNLNNITFDVDTSLAGFNNFNGETQILSLAVAGGTSSYILVKLVIGLYNPSQITITLGDMMLTTIMNEYNAAVGDVYLTGVTLKPGNNTLDAEMHMASTDTKALSQLLSDYMTGAHVPLTVAGSDQSTEIPSLKNGMATVKLATAMEGIKTPLVVSTKVTAGLEVITAKKANAKVTLRNPLETQFAIEAIEAVIFTTIDGNHFQVGHINYNLPSAFTVPAGGQATSDEWPVNVDANLLQLVQLMTAKDLTVDLQQNVTMTVGDGFRGEMYYYQNSVPTEIDLSILGLNLNPDGSNNNQAAASQLPDSILSQLPESALSALGIKPTSSSADGSTPTAEATPTDAPGSKDGTDQSTQDSSKEGVLPTLAPASSKSAKAEETSSSTSSSNGAHWLWPFNI